MEDKATEETGKVTVVEKEVFSSFIEELQGFDSENLPVIDDEKEDGEEVIGIISSESTKRLFGIMMSYTEELSEFLSNNKDKILGGDTDTVHKAKFLCKKSDLIRDIFWFDVERELNISCKSIGIRKGWEIVSIGDSSNGISSMMSMMNPMIGLQMFMDANRQQD